MCWQQKYFPVFVHIRKRIWFCEATWGDRREKKKFVVIQLSPHVSAVLQWFLLERSLSRIHGPWVQFNTPPTDPITPHPFSFCSMSCSAADHCLSTPMARLIASTGAGLPKLTNRKGIYFLSISRKVISLRAAQCSVVHDHEKCVCGCSFAD